MTDRTGADARRRRGIALRCGGLACAVAFALVAGCADGLFYRPDQAVHSTPASHACKVDEVTFAAPDGPALHGWWLTARAAPRGTVVYCHGNHANLTLHAEYVAWLPARGWDVLIFDYRGYGRSAGSPTRAGTVADALAAIDFALARDPERTVVFGHSLGGAIAIVAAAERPAVRAVAVESTFPSYRAIAAEKAWLLACLVPLLVSDGSDPDDALAALPPRPLLVIHGADDGIVPFALGEALFARAHEPKEFHRASGAGHFTPWVREGDAFEARLCDFFARAIECR